MLYLWLKAFHIIFMVTWFAGLFYLPRLFVYHAMAEDPATREHLKIMERKLYRFVSPLMWLMIGFGLWLIYINGWDWFAIQTWLQIKLVLVTILIGYHFYCGKMVNDFKDDQNVRNHVFYRWFNEFPVLFLFAIVILAVIKQPLLGD
jgi:putative membrane protein